MIVTLYLAVNHGQDGLDLQRSANARSPRPDAPTASEELQRVHAKSNQARLALGALAGLVPAATLLVPIEAAELIEAVRRFCGTLAG